MTFINRTTSRLSNSCVTISGVHVAYGTSSVICGSAVYTNDTCHNCNFSVPSNSIITNSLAFCHGILTGAISRYSCHCVLGLRIPPACRASVFSAVYTNNRCDSEMFRGVSVSKGCATSLISRSGYSSIMGLCLAILSLGAILISAVYRNSACRFNSAIYTASKICARIVRDRSKYSSAIILGLLMLEGGFRSDRVVYRNSRIR